MCKDKGERILDASDSGMRPGCANVSAFGSGKSSANDWLSRALSDSATLRSEVCSSCRAETSTVEEGGRNEGEWGELGGVRFACLSSILLSR